MNVKTIVLAAGVLLASAGVASAAVVTNDVNLRSGPGTRYRVIDTLPAGAQVDVLGCTGSWCRVNWQGQDGYASANYLGGADDTTTVYGDPDYYDAPYYAGPIFGFGGFGRRHFGFRGGFHHGGFHGGGHFGGGHFGGGHFGGGHGGGGHGGHR